MYVGHDVRHMVERNEAIDNVESMWQRERVSWPSNIDRAMPRPPCSIKSVTRMDLNFRIDSRYEKTKSLYEKL